MLTSDFDYELPSHLIAQHPPAERTAARMLVLDRASERCLHRAFTDLPEYLRPGDLVVLNDTRVFPARIEGHWCDTGGQVELLLLEPVEEAMAATPVAARYHSVWEALCGSGRKARPGLHATFGGGALKAEILRPAADGGVVVALTGEQPPMELLARFGRTPLPPYISRDGRQPAVAAEDQSRYQTVYARHTGAVAAPTAGLHFTTEFLSRLAAKGVALATVTLHVGPGTFQPVKAENPDEHRMHAERYTVMPAAAAAIAACRQHGGRILAVGSTSVRTLETMAAEHDGHAAACAGRSRLFIRPPYDFRLTDRMLTNFHLPRSTLLMMVAAFAGRERVLSAYREAMAAGYRFYSYGDCMLLL
ncbi:MAG: tRNA preQ1(34) S-adenosylmethionine ribosyltransferase-isomerase QueA [Kiritimatiellae bacterium]|nr:tRNA preQ1(34) S-adenosylmethionine ribosyltransferase-isomerase QueA [Kiritimatiellia bacterium]